MHRILLTTALVASTTLPVAAQDRSLWSLLHPDQIAGQLLRSGVMALRSQMDVIYSGLSVSIADGTISVDDLTLVLYDNITGGDVCDISMAGLSGLTDGPFALDRISVSLRAQSVTLGESCFPAEAKPVLGMLGQRDIRIPEVSISVDYDVPTAAARMSLTATVDDVAAATLDLDFAYVTIWAGDGPEELNATLRRASMVIDDLGGWENVSRLLPPPFTNPDTAGAAVSQALGQVIAAEAGGTVVSKSAKTFIADAARGWADFVADPGRLVIETGFSPSDPVFLNPAEIERGVLPLIDSLQPTVARVAAVERDALPAALIAQALDAPDTLSQEARRAVGLALLTGVQAPRAIGPGVDLLADLAMQGDGEVALAIARALAATAPDDAYQAAIVAGASGTPGARQMLDAIEDDLPFDVVLDLQIVDNPPPETDELDLPTMELAERAEAYLSGVGAPRSLRHALLYASLASARGHAGGPNLLDRIDRAVPRDGLEAWAPAADEVAEIALQAWIDAGR